MKTPKTTQISGAYTRLTCSFGPGVSSRGETGCEVTVPVLATSIWELADVPCSELAVGQMQNAYGRFAVPVDSLCQPPWSVSSMWSESVSPCCQALEVVGWDLVNKFGYEERCVDSVGD